MTSSVGQNSLSKQYHKWEQIAKEIPDDLTLEQELEHQSQQQVSEKFRTEGNQCYSCGNFTQAIKHYSNALILHPDNPILLTNRAQSYLQVGSIDLAMQDVEKCLQVAPNSWKAFAKRAECWVAKNQFDKALQDLASAQHLAPHVYELFWRMREVRLQAQETQLESDVLSQVEEDSIDCLDQFVHLLLHLFQKVQIEDSLHKLIELFKDPTLLPQKKAYFLYLQGFKALADLIAWSEPLKETGTSLVFQVVALACKGSYRAVTQVHQLSFLHLFLKSPVSKFSDPTLLFQLMECLALTRAGVRSLISCDLHKQLEKYLSDTTINLDFEFKEENCTTKLESNQKKTEIIQTEIESDEIPFLHKKEVNQMPSSQVSNLSTTLSVLNICGQCAHSAPFLAIIQRSKQFFCSCLSRSAGSVVNACAATVISEFSSDSRGKQLLKFATSPDIFTAFFSLIQPISAILEIKPEEEMSIEVTALISAFLTVLVNAAHEGSDAISRDALLNPKLIGLVEPSVNFPTAPTPGMCFIQQISKQGMAKHVMNLLNMRDIETGNLQKGLQFLRDYCTVNTAARKVLIHRKFYCTLIDWLPKSNVLHNNPEQRKDETFSLVVSHLCQLAKTSPQVSEYVFSSTKFMTIFGQLKAIAAESSQEICSASGEALLMLTSLLLKNNDLVAPFIETKGMEAALWIFRNRVNQTNIYHLSLTCLARLAKLPAAQKVLANVLDPNEQNILTNRISLLKELKVL